MGFEKEDGRVDPQHRRNLGPILKITVFGPLGNSLSLCVHPECTSESMSVSVSVCAFVSVSVSVSVSVCLCVCVCDCVCMCVNQTRTALGTLFTSASDVMSQKHDAAGNRVFFDESEELRLNPHTRECLPTCTQSGGFFLEDTDLEGIPVGEASRNSRGQTILSRHAA
jgi:hypothetical protein